GGRSGQCRVAGARNRPGATLRVGRAVCRRRPPLSGARAGSGAAADAALPRGLVASLYQARVAESRLQQVRSLADALVFDVHDAVRDLPGSTRARALIVKTGVSYLNSLLGSARGDARSEARLATAYRKLGDAQGDVHAS